MECELFWQDCCLFCRQQLWGVDWSRDKTHTSCSKKPPIDKALSNAHRENTESGCMYTYTRPATSKFIWGSISQYPRVICLWACWNCYSSLLRFPVVLLILLRPLALASFNKTQIISVWGQAAVSFLCFSQEHYQARKLQRSPLTNPVNLETIQTHHIPMASLLKHFLKAFFCFHLKNTVIYFLFAIFRSCCYWKALTYVLECS